MTSVSVLNTSFTGFTKCKRDKCCLMPHWADHDLFTLSLQVIAIVMDVFTDVDLFKEAVDASIRGVPVYVLLDESHLKSFLTMAENQDVKIQQLRVRIWFKTSIYFIESNIHYSYGCWRVIKYSLFLWWQLLLMLLLLCFNEAPSIININGIFWGWQIKTTLKIVWLLGNTLIHFFAKI